MLQHETLNWLNSFYEEYPTTFRVFFFLLGWAIGSSIKIAVLQHRLAKH